MRILVIILCALLLACIGGMGFFYMELYQPLEQKMKISMPEFDKTKAELVKYKGKEKTEATWMLPMTDALNAQLSDEIKAGAIEVLTTGTALVVNITEQALYLPGSRTFAKESPRLLAKLDALLRNERINGKEITVGNTTEPVPAQTRGRIKSPQKDARALAAERSMELIKYLEKKGVKPDMLVAAAYASSQQTPGIKIKDRKTVITIETPRVAVADAKQPPVPAPAAQTKPTTTAVSSATATAAAPSAAKATAPTPTEQSKPSVTTKPSGTPTPTSTTTTTAPAPQSGPKPVPTRPAAPKTN